MNSRTLRSKASACFPVDRNGRHQAALDAEYGRNRRRMTQAASARPDRGGHRQNRCSLCARRFSRRPAPGTLAASSAMGQSRVRRHLKLAAPATRHQRHPVIFVFAHDHRLGAHHSRQTKKDDFPSMCDPRASAFPVRPCCPASRRWSRADRRADKSKWFHIGRRKCA